ncbi:MAG TPA: ECF-type sigma factor [Gemmataceae bacterium]|jgi:DNA-directed RNA polymerase specialized sigma24 family protein
MGQPNSQPDLADLLRRGDSAAGALLLQRYAERLIALARQHLDQRLRGKVDPEDVEQSVLRSFFRHHAEGEWDISDENALWPLLVRITLYKCHRHLEHFLAARRDVRREVEPAKTEQAAIDPEPTPEEAARFAETAETVMNRLGTEIKRDIFRLSLQGYSVVEISERVRYYERGVERVRAEIRTLLQAMMADDRP